MGPRRWLPLLALFSSACGPDPVQVDREQLELGRRLFYDFELSVDGKRSCGICHEQEKGFTDGFVRSVGHAGDLLPRNALSLINVARRPALLWTGEEGLTLEEQLLVPLLGDSPPEMGMTEHLSLTKLEADGVYRPSFASAFPEDEKPISVTNLAKAIARFERSILADDAPFDRYRRGETTALKAAAQRGLQLFESERLQCFRCHSGPDLDQPAAADGQLLGGLGRFNTGLYNLDGAGAYPDFEQGLIAKTGRREDMGVFRTAPLRNLEATAPFMHDGSVPTLNAVIDNYAAGGRFIPDGPLAGDGRENPFKDPLIQGFEITEAERADLLAFLASLSDEGLLTRPEIADPFPRD